MRLRATAAPLADGALSDTDGGAPPATSGGEGEGSGVDGTERGGSGAGALAGGDVNCALVQTAGWLDARTGTEYRDTNCAARFCSNIKRRRASTKRLSA